ncbi:methionine adenosyltransferase [Cereibacter changlensis]|uniref:Methionine adenosyltransferase n=2 Tax=Cereibacter changlensis TaxID=402884 RepID=A0A4U0YY35_9RHOB|nr:methionine adenosyltransferase [Cereibacter changlensis]
MKSGLFTSESVSDGHPDKICDQISDAILDACLAQDPVSRVAMETAVKGDLLCLIGEITTLAEVDFEAVARDVLRDIGHDGGRWGVDPDRIRILRQISQQSPEISSGVSQTETGAGDQGMMFGFACTETPELMPLPIQLSHQLMRRHRDLRLTGVGQSLGPDAKSQVTVRYEDGRPREVTHVVLSSQHARDLGLNDLREILREEVAIPVLGDWITGNTVFHLNPAGSFHVGGPQSDAGLTGRKIIVDTYGGYARHGGGAFSGKDPTKVDRSGAYAARQLARDVVGRGWASGCEARVAYAIGVAEPLEISFSVTGTEAPEALYREAGVDLADLMRPRSVIERLNLRKPRFRQTATFGHFGQANFSWEMPLVSSA